MSTRRTESFTAHPTHLIIDGQQSQERNPEQGSIKQLMTRLKIMQPNTMKVSRRENDAVYHNFDYAPVPRKSKKGFFIERQIRNLKAREDSKRQSLKHKQETAAEKAAKAQRQKDMEKMKMERDRKFRMNEQIKLDRE